MRQRGGAIVKLWSALVQRRSPRHCANPRRHRAAAPAWSGVRNRRPAGRGEPRWRAATTCLRALDAAQARCRRGLADDDAAGSTLSMPMRTTAAVLAARSAPSGFCNVDDVAAAAAGLPTSARRLSRRRRQSGRRAPPRFHRRRGRDDDRVAPPRVAVASATNAAASPHDAWPAIVIAVPRCAVASTASTATWRRLEDAPRARRNRAPPTHEIGRCRRLKATRRRSAAHAGDASWETAISTSSLTGERRASSTRTCNAELRPRVCGRTPRRNGRFGKTSPTRRTLGSHTLATGSDAMSTRVASKTSGWNLPCSGSPLATVGAPLRSVPSISAFVPSANR